jgi:hypothetical protein
VRARGLLLVAAGLAWALGATRAARAADASEGGDDTAEALFARGRDAMLRGDYEAGCPLLAASDARDPRLGVTFTLAECEWRWGKTARAVTHYDAFLRAYARARPPRGAANDERQRIATARRASLAPRVGFVTIVLPAPRPAGSSVTLDGRALPDDALGAEIPVEPGEASIALEGIPGGSRVRVAVVAGEHRTVTLAAPGEGAPSAAVPVVVAPRAPAPETPSRDGGEAPRAPSAWIYGTAAVTVVALGVGAVTGAMVLAKRDAIDAHCPDHRCDAEGLADVDTARRLGVVSTASFAVGAAALVATAYLFFVRPKPMDAAGALSTPRRSALEPRVAIGAAPAPGGAAAVLSGAW